MSVHRLAKYQTADPFTRVPNSAINDGRLDLKALGLLVSMLSKPDGWRFTERNLAADAGVGRAQLRTAMATLIESGYVLRHHEQVDGRPVVVTAVYDTSQGPETGPSPGSDSPRVRKPDRPETGPGSNEVGVVTNENPETKEKPSDVPSDPLPDVPPETRRLAHDFALLVRANGHPLPAAGSKTAAGWLREMDRLLRLGPPGDGGHVPDVGEVDRVMRWALCESDFWPANIRSIPKFRERWSTLRLQAARASPSSTSAAMYDAIAERLDREGPA